MCLLICICRGLPWMSLHSFVGSKAPVGVHCLRSGTLSAQLHLSRAVLCTHLQGTLRAQSSERQCMSQVTAITARGDPNSRMAELTPDTQVTFESAQPFLKIKGNNSVQRLFKKDFDIAELGIGGLDDQFSAIFRGAFASRAVPGHIAKAMNIQHTKGILLFGPPGTGMLAVHRILRRPARQSTCMCGRQGAPPV